MSAKAKILAYLKTGAELTPADALRLFGCFRLGARIYDLRQEGFEIADLRQERKVNYSVYVLAASPSAGDSVAPHVEASARLANHARAASCAPAPAVPPGYLFDPSRRA